MISKELIEKNKKRLVDEQKRLLEVIKHDDTADAEFPGGMKPKYDELGNEEGDNASEIENFGNQLAVTEELESQLKKIEWALARIKNGTYGVCSEGDEIEEKRLEALPTAETCIKHSK